MRVRDELLGVRHIIVNSYVTFDLDIKNRNKPRVKHFNIKNVTSKTDCMIKVCTLNVLIPIHEYELLNKTWKSCLYLHH